MVAVVVRNVAPVPPGSFPLPDERQGKDARWKSHWWKMNNALTIRIPVVCPAQVPYDASTAVTSECHWGHSKVDNLAP